MPEVRYLKVFKGKPKYNNPDELTDLKSLEVIKANKFPHTEKGLVVIALVRFEKNFSGELRIRIPDTSKDYWEMLFQNPLNDYAWLTLEYGEVDVIFDKPGKYTVDFSINNKPFHKIHLHLEVKGSD